MISEPANVKQVNMNNVSEVFQEKLTVQNETPAVSQVRLDNT